MSLRLSAIGHLSCILLESGRWWTVTVTPLVESHRRCSDVPVSKAKTGRGVLQRRNATVDGWTLEMVDEFAEVWFSDAKIEWFAGLR